MDAPTHTSAIRFNRFLPYWAVLQTDLRQTLRSWVYRLWVLMTVICAGGSILYKVGVHREAGIVHTASVQTGDLLRVLVIASLALVALLAVSAVGAERSTVADAVLSRGISRYQYFLAKWHARVLVVVSTFVALSVAVLVTHHFLFDPDLTLHGGLMAIAVVASVLLLVVTWGVTIGSFSSGTVIGITVFWLMLYGGMALASLLPEPYPTPERILGRLKFILRGQYDAAVMWEIVGVGLTMSAITALIGMVGFSRKDV